MGTKGSVADASIPDPPERDGPSASIFRMPEIRDWWEREFKGGRNGGTNADKRERRGRSPRMSEPGRPRNRSPDPCEALVDYAGRLIGPLAGRFPASQLLRHLAHVCRERSDLLDGRAGSRFDAALIALSVHWRDWLRPPEDWEPQGDTPAERFASLARHLFALYDIPEFMDAAWKGGLSAEGVRFQGWFKHLGHGGSIRTADDLPLPMTKRMAHHFLETPADCGILPAFRRAQVLALGGDERLARAVIASRIATDFAEDEFWGTVFRWLIDHPSVSPSDYGPILDFLHEQRYVPSVPNRAGRACGQRRQSLLVPPQPNLCMKGRTPASLLRDVEAWHKRQGSERKATGLDWKPSGIAPFTLRGGEGIDRKTYAVTELICDAELEEEGSAMGHCVATYRMLCWMGRSSIWSLTVEDSIGRTQRLLTLQIRNEDRALIQARGVSNRVVNAEEVRILRRWEDLGGPTFSTWFLIGEPPIDE